MSEQKIVGDEPTDEKTQRKIAGVARQNSLMREALELSRHQGRRGKPWQEKWTKVITELAQMPCVAVGAELIYLELIEAMVTNAPVADQRIILCLVSMLEEEASRTAIQSDMIHRGLDGYDRAHDDTEELVRSVMACEAAARNRWRVGADHFAEPMNVATEAQP